MMPEDPSTGSFPAAIWKLDANHAFRGEWNAILQENAPFKDRK
jgi:hypothetical protein